jgi:hypothetical protein
MIMLLEDAKKKLIDSKLSLTNKSLDNVNGLINNLSKHLSENPNSEIIVKDLGENDSLVHSIKKVDNKIVIIIN